MKDEKLICCCGSSGWAKVIGWYELIISVIQIAFITWFLISWALIDLADVNEGFFSTGVTSFFFFMTSFGLNVIIAKLVFEILAFTMALALLWGSYMGNPRYLQVWIGFTVIYIVLVICLFGINLILVGELYPLMTWVIWLAIQKFCVWVVIIHRNEMKALHLAGPHSSYQYPYKHVSYV